VPRDEEAKRAYMREYRKKNKEAGRLYAKARRARLRERIRDESLVKMRRHRGVLSATAERRAGVCPVCLKDGPLVLDHDHVTGVVRGWLCGHCNRALGALGDTAAGLKRAYDYLLACEARETR
jgi:hypothetical protein